MQPKPRQNSGMANAKHVKLGAPIEVRAQVWVGAPITTTFSELLEDAAGLPRYFRGLPPLIPGIAAAQIIGDGETIEGSLRRVVLTDGTQICERVLRHERPTIHSYEMAEMNRLQRMICSQMTSEWRFEEEGTGTRIAWTYAIYPRNAMTKPITHLIARLFQRAMRRCLALVAESKQ